MHSENVNFALKNCSGALHRLPRILRSESGNSALKKWKFGTQKWKFGTQKMENFPGAIERKSTVSTTFRAKSGNAALPRSRINSTFAESWRD